VADMTLTSSDKLLDNSMFTQWPDGLLVLDKAQNIVKLNAIAEDLLGYCLDELWQKNAHTLLCAPNCDYQHEIGQCPLNLSNGIVLNEFGETWWIKKKWPIYSH